MPGIRRSDGRRIAGSSVKKPRRKTRLTPQTTLQHSGCSVVSAVKTIWLHLRAGFRQPSPAPSPFRLSGSVSLVLAPCHSASHSAPPYPFPPHPAPPAHSLPRSFPLPLPVPSRIPLFRPVPPHSPPFRHSPGSAHRNYSSKKQKNAPFFLFFHFLAPYLSYK